MAGDGCGVPVFGMTLAAIALAFARLAELSMLSRKRAEAARRIISAMVAHPYLVGGATGSIRSCSKAAGRSAGQRRRRGRLRRGDPRARIGTRKIDDGAKRASETVMAALLAKYCEQHVPFRQMVIELCRRPVLGAASPPAISGRRKAGSL